MNRIKHHHYRAADCFFHVVVSWFFSSSSFTRYGNSFWGNSCHPILGFGIMQHKHRDRFIARRRHVGGARGRGEGRGVGVGSFAFGLGDRPLDGVAVAPAWKHAMLGWGWGGRRRRRGRWVGRSQWRPRKRPVFQICVCVFGGGGVDGVYSSSFLSGLRSTMACSSSAVYLCGRGMKGRVSRSVRWYLG